MDPELKKALEDLGMTQNKAIEAQNKALADLREAHEADVKKRDALYDDKIAKLQAELDKFEPLNAALTKAQQEAEKAAVDRKEQQEQLDRIETKLNRPGIGHNNGPEMTAERIGFFDHARFGLDRMQADRKNVLTVSDDTGGGYLAPSDYLLEIIKAAIEFSPFRSAVRVRSTSQKSVQIPKRTGVFSARWTGETETRSETKGLAYGLEDVPVHELTAEVYVSMANLEDSAFDVEGELRMEFAEQFGVAEGGAIVSGVGTKKPEGFLTATGTVNVNSGVADNLSADSLLLLKYGLKTEYARRASWAMNRTTLGLTRRLKDGNGNYVWIPGLAEGRPNTIDGDPYIEAPDMPNVAAGTKPVAYADWQRSYTLVDRLAMGVVRDGLTRASEGQVKFVARRRVGGQVTLAEAIALMTIAA
jgi:HK97 family phage major capsid protein